MYVAIGILMLMLVVNWTYLVLASRHTSRLSDVLTFSAVTELLDESWLADHADFGSTLQTDDIAAASDTITNPATGLLKRNNEVAGPALRPSAANPGEVTIVAARVPDASQLAAGANFNPTPTPAEPYNSLRVEIFRDPSGPNPVLLLMRGFGSPHAAKITGAATVTLDSRLIGFRPQSSLNAPVAPLALAQNQFFATRQAGSLDNNGNGIKELDFYLKPTAVGETLNSALVSLNAGLSINIAGSTVEDQIRAGCSAADFAGGFLGPVAPSGSTIPYVAGATISLDADQNSNNGSISAAGLASAFDDVRAGNYPRRIFPVYSSYSDPLTIVGFVGARIVSADSFGGRLRIRLEPDFIVHATAETRPVEEGNPVPENIYIHKTRLTR